jgi:hypothetical protein
MLLFSKESLKQLVGNAQIVLGHRREITFEGSFNKKKQPDGCFDCKSDIF